MAKDRYNGFTIALRLTEPQSKVIVWLEKHLIPGITLDRSDVGRTLLTEAMEARGFDLSGAEDPDENPVQPPKRKPTSGVHVGRVKPK